MNIDVDPILLNLSVPLIDAVCASVCSDWFEAADLWFEVCREPRYRPLAVQCGAEASLQSGLLDLAEYFYIGLNEELDELPEFLKVLRQRNEPIRLARVKYYSQRLAADRHGPRGDTARELMRLHFFREAVRFLLVSADFRERPATVAPMLARAYRMLGAHASLIGLYETQGAFLGDTDLRESLSRAKRLLARQSDKPMKNVGRFQDQHPAGPLFTHIVERLAREARANT